MATLKLNLNKNRPAGPASLDAERRGPLRGRYLKHSVAGRRVH